MKKFFSYVFMIVFCAFALAQQPTPNIGLQIPATGSNNWYIPLNYNFSKLDQLLSGNIAIPALSITNNLTVGGSVSAVSFIGPGGSSFATAVAANQFSPVYYSAAGSGTALNGVSPFTGPAWYRSTNVPIPATALLLGGLWSSCSSSVPALRFDGTCYAPSGGGSTPSSPALSVQIANSGVTAITSDPNILIDPVAHQTEVVGSGSRLITVTNPSGTANWTGNPASDFSSNTFNDKRNAQWDSFKSTVFGGPGGFNYGPGPGVTNNWTSSAGNFWTFFFNRRGITQYQSGNILKRATGDFAGLYFNQVYGVGGITGNADEGGVGNKINGGEALDWYTGTATAGAATGNTILPKTAGVQTCDGCFVYDASKPGPSGHFIAAPTFVTVGTAGYWSEQIDTAVTPSTAYGVPVCTLPQLTDQTIAQTVACTVTGALGSTGLYVSGVASLSGPYAEQVSVAPEVWSNTTTYALGYVLTFSGTAYKSLVAANVGHQPNTSPGQWAAITTLPAGASQVVNVTYRNPHVSGQFILWQGGTAQGMLQQLTNDAAISGVPNGYTVFGAPDSTHLAAGIAKGGGEFSPETNFVAPVALTGLSKSGSTITAAINLTLATNYVPFDNIASATISSAAGCVGGTPSATGTNFKINFLASTITWTDAGTATSCTGANLSYVPAVTAYQLYPYAEQIAAGDISTQVTLEPNIVPFASGDNLVQPHPPTFGYNAVWHDTKISNMHGEVGSTGIFQTYLGTGINGNFNFLRLQNNNNCNLYQGCGGVLGLQPWALLSGPNWGTIASTIPINPTKFAMSFSCPVGYGSSPGVAGVCNGTENVLAMPLGNITLDGVSGWNFTGTGLHTIGVGAFDGGLTASSFSVFNQKAVMKTSLSSSGGLALSLQGQFNNGGPMADLQFYDYTDSLETGRISSSFAFGNLMSVTHSVGGQPFLGATWNGATLAVNVAGTFTHNGTNAVCDASNNCSNAQLAVSNAWAAAQNLPTGSQVNSHLICTVDGTNCPSVQIRILGTTASIGGSALAAGACSTGTATIAGGVAGHAVDVSTSDGSDIGGSFFYRGVTTNSTTVTVSVCAAVAGTPAAKTYNIATY